MARTPVAAKHRTHARRGSEPEAVTNPAWEDEGPSPDHAVTRLSSKNQITLPVAMVRALGMKSGDEIDLRVLGARISVSRRPQTPQQWVAKFYGSMNVPGWGTQEEIDAYVRGERDAWDETNS